jgi:hypothetical protein
MEGRLIEVRPYLFQYCVFSKIIVESSRKEFVDLKIEIESHQQGQIMLVNQRVCLHFASLPNQNA